MPAPQSEGEILAVLAAAMERDQFRCVMCGTTNEESLKHHGQSLIVYQVEPADTWTVEDCATLCKFCHTAQPKHEDEPNL